MTLLEFLENKNIVILGFGSQGKATYNYLRKHFKNKTITIADKNENIDRSELDENTELKLGEKYLENLEKFDLIIKSPGVILKDIDISGFEDKIITDYELLLKYTKGLKIGVTGTKGKSTTSTILYEVLKKQGKKVFLVGNIGNPILNEIDNIDENTITVIEVSSHTLEFAKVSPDIAILLNIYPEHLDHCNSLSDYINAKFNIARYQTNKDYFIYNNDNELIKEYKFDYKENDIQISINANTTSKNKVYLKENSIYFNNMFLMNSDEKLQIKGEHNINNILFVFAVSEILKLDLDKTIETVKEVKPLKHRMEYIGKVDEIEFYDDAIATIPEATINCIKTLKNVNTLICGGMDRGIRQDELIKFLKNSNVENVICMPETGYIIYDYLKEFKNVYKATNMQEAVKIAKEVTKKNMICLLSPSASSYNDFKNFEEKGDIFKKLIEG